MYVYCQIAPQKHLPNTLIRCLSMINYYVFTFVPFYGGRYESQIVKQQKKVKITFLCHALMMVSSERTSSISCEENWNWICILNSTQLFYYVCVHNFFLRGREAMRNFWIFKFFFCVFINYFKVFADFFSISAYFSNFLIYFARFSRCF